MQALWARWVLWGLCRPSEVPESLHTRRASTESRLSRCFFRVWDDRIQIAPIRVRSFTLCHISRVYS